MTSPYNFNPPHPHPDHVHQPSNNAFQDPNAISNGAYDGFSSVFAGDADFVGVGDEGWVYQPDRLSAPSLGFGDHQSLYHNAYADTQGAQLQNAGFGAESAFSNFHQIPLDPSLNNADARNPTNTPSAFAAPDNANGGTIAPEALQNRISPPKLKVESPQTQAVTPNETESLAKTSPPVLPSGSRVGKFLVISPDTLSQIANSRPLAKFVSVGNTPYDVPITKSTIPAYVPRKSRNEIRQILKNDNRATASKFKKISKKSGTLTQGPTRRDATSRLSGTAAAQRQSESSSEEESTESSSESESSDEEVLQAPLPSSRPSAPLQATHYDAVKALWRPSGHLLDNASIRDGISKFWDLVSTIRNRWKSDAEEVKKAKEANKTNDVPLLEERVDKQREMLQIALQAAIEFGHVEIIENFGGNVQFMVLLAQFLTDRARVGDYSGALPRTILQLLSRCKSLSNGDLEKTNLAKVFQRFSKRGDETTKSLTKKVTDNAVAVSKKKMGSSKVSGSAASQKQEPQSQVMASAAGTKRRGSDPTAGQPAKKVATAGDRNTFGDTATSASKKPAHNTATARSGSTSATPSGVKQKITQVQAKPSQMFSLLKSAKKTSTPSTATAIPPSEKATSRLSDSSSIETPTNKINHSDADSTKSQLLPAQKPSGPPPKQTSSFAQAMAAATGVQRSEEVAKSGNKRLLETEEEARKRRRKEARRNLHVSFKADPELTEIHEFQHDPEEELGHDASQTRDVRDTKGEGRMFSHMFKIQHRDGDEEDEDQSDPLEDHQRPFKFVSAVDFSVLADTVDELIPGDPRTTNYERYGGFLQPECPEREIQKSREESTLVEVYTKSSSIPPSPKEPSQEQTQAQTQASPKPFGSLSEDIASRFDAAERTRAGGASDAYSSPSDKLLSMLERFGALDYRQESAQQTTEHPSPPIPDLSAVLSQLSAPARQPSPPSHFDTSSANQPFPQPSNTDLSAILASMRQPQQNNFGQSQNPEFNQGYGQNFNQGFGQGFSPNQQPQNNNTAGMPTTDLSAMLASLAQQNQNQNQNQNPTQPSQPFPMPPPQFPTQQPQFEMPSMPNVPSMPLPPFPTQNTDLEKALQAQWQTMLQSGQNPLATNPFQQQSSNLATENPDRRRRREHGNNQGDEVDDVNGFKRRGNWKQTKSGRDKSPPKFVLPCKYWQLGRCQKGTNCTYRHDIPQQTS